MRKRGIDLRLLLSLPLLVLVAGRRGAAEHRRLELADGERTGHGGGFPGGRRAVAGDCAAPALALRNYIGEPVNIDAYRGKAVLVTFLYTNCPDMCPLITSNLRVAQNLMGRSVASKAQIIAVSVDPKGDTPRRSRRFWRAMG